MKNIYLEYLTYLINNILDYNSVMFYKILYRKNNINLHINKKRSKEILTVIGYIDLSRTALTNRKDKERKEDETINIVPLDKILKINNNKFKMSISMLIEISHFSILLNSYEKSKNMMEKIYNIKISKETIRKVTN